MAVEEAIVFFAVFTVYLPHVSPATSRREGTSFEGLRVAHAGWR
jgi:hypothetical protein